MHRPRLAIPLLVFCACHRPAPSPEPLHEPAPVSDREPLPDSGPPLLPKLHDKVLRLKKNSTLSQLLRAEKTTAKGLLEALRPVLDLRKLQVGDLVHVWRDDSGTCQQVVIDRSPWERVVAVNATDSWQALLQTDPTIVRTERISFTVESSLYQSLVDAGDNPELAFALADMFAWDLDFYHDVQKNDHVVALVEVRRRASDGGFIQYGKLTAASYAGLAGHFTGFRYQQTEGEEEAYFDEDGRSLRKAFLKSPLKYAHLSSKFGSRVHPVLGYTRQHMGIDLTASVGTPVWAVGDGTVIQAGWAGGYGKFVMIRHPNGLDSAYGHLSQIFVHAGQRVAQKLVIAATGNTGLSTGPHLHFGIRRAGVFINPLAIKLPRVDPLTPEALPKFRAFIAPQQAELADPAELAAAR